MSSSSVYAPLQARLLQQCAALDTASLSDALDSLGIAAGLPGIVQQVPGTRFAGVAFTVLYEPIQGAAGFKNAANYIDEVPPGSVVVSSNAGRLDATVWGDILTHVALSRNIQATVIDGVARDIDTVTRLKYPLFSRGRFMQSGKNRVQLKTTQVPVQIDGVVINPGDLIVGDASGCLVIPIDIAEQVISRAQSVQNTERDIIASVNQGLSLAEARRLHRYDQPWLATESKTFSAV